MKKLKPGSLSVFLLILILAFVINGCSEGQIPEVSDDYLINEISDDLDADDEINEDEPDDDSNLTEDADDVVEEPDGSDDSDDSEDSDGINGTDNGDIDAVASATSVAAATVITGEEARAMTENDDDAILLDVRNQNEFDEFHLYDSILIPVDELEKRLSELQDKSASIIVFCRAGRRSAQAAEILIANGFVNVYDMGSIDNWAWG